MINQCDKDLSDSFLLRLFHKKLKPDDVQVVELAICDNDIHNNRKFSEKLLEDFCTHFLGKPVNIFSEVSKEKISATIFDTWLLEEDRKTKDGDSYISLRAKMYLMKSPLVESFVEDWESPEGMILNINSNIIPENDTCSICGKPSWKKVSDGMWRRVCDHKPGESYDGTVCCFVYTSIRSCSDLSCSY